MCVVGKRNPKCYDSFSIVNLSEGDMLIFFFFFHMNCCNHNLSLLHASQELHDRDVKATAVNTFMGH